MIESELPVDVSRPSYLRYFPYERPYDHQREAMAAIADALEAGTDVLFEGATGTGKTLASLVPALEYARETDKTVVITTNVHQQMRQFRREASAIASTDDLRAVVFRGKGSMCHIDVGYEECQALRETTRELVETQDKLSELTDKQQELLAEGQAGNTEATQARTDILTEIDELEEQLDEFEDRTTCDHYYQNLTGNRTEFFAWLYDDVRTPDEIYNYAHERGFCGYELLKDGVEGVDLVVCNYHHLLDPVIREQFFRWLGREPEEVIAIFDEAHNIERAARDHAQQTVTETTIESALEELDSVEDARSDSAYNVLSTFLRALRMTYEDTADASGPVSGTGDAGVSSEYWTDISVENESRRDELTLAFLREYSGPGYETELEQAIELGTDLDTEYEKEYKRGETSVRKECQTLQAAPFVESWLTESDESGTYPVVSVRRRDSDHPNAGEIYGRAELYTCIPEEVTRSLFSDLYANVLMSATLRPFDVTEDVLGITEPERIAHGPQFPETHRRTYAVDGPALFASSRDEAAVQRTVTSVLEDAVRMTPGNTLAFFPSYGEAERYHARVNAPATYLDEPGKPAHKLREQFVDEDNALLCTSLWGTLGEGVSYDGDDARTVVVVGVPYPHLDDRMDAVQEAYDTAFGAESERVDAGWYYAVEIPTVRKTRQALGRVVRSPEDFGARILLDARYTERAEIEMPEYAVRGAFPPEQRAEMIDVDPAKLKYGLLNFYADMDAYDGQPPSP